MPNTATSMVVVSAIAEMREALTAARANGARIGFVPTMGALHAGHLSLVDRARRDADTVVMSIFVNPLQFGPAEDLARYPRLVEADDNLATQAGVDFLFRPAAAEMYTPGRTVSVAGGALASAWEGEMRPGHFDGVLTVVAKLLNIVAPDFAVFGRKDLQQAAVVRAMVRDLNLPVSIVLSPIVREQDGLAMSSRNRYLTSEERRSALALNRSLKGARALYESGERSAVRLEQIGRDIIGRDAAIKLDYFAVVDPATFERDDIAGERSAAIVAARVGTTRLIDNLTLGANED